jgi:hypothetical protein
MPDQLTAPEMEILQLIDRGFNTLDQIRSGDKTYVGMNKFFSTSHTDVYVSGSIERMLISMTKAGYLCVNGGVWSRGGRRAGEPPVPTHAVPDPEDMKDSAILQEMKLDSICAIVGYEEQENPGPDDYTLRSMKRRARALQRAEHMALAAEGLAEIIKGDKL